MYVHFTFTFVCSLLMPGLQILRPRGIMPSGLDRMLFVVRKDLCFEPNLCLRPARETNRPQFIERPLPSRAFPPILPSRPLD